MRYYNQQLNAMIEALAAGQMVPPRATAQAFGNRRINACSKALSMLNLFVPEAGNFPEANSNATFSIYTKPLQRDVIVMGAALMCSDETAIPSLIGEFRLRLPEPLEHLSQGYIFPAMGFAPAAWSIFFPAPFILKASEQIAVDFGWNNPASQEDTITSRFEIVLYCVSVKDCLTGEDQTLLNECAKIIASYPFQRRVYLNSFTHGSRAVTSQSNSQFESNQDNTVVYPPQNVSSITVAKNLTTTSETRPADLPMLVVGVAINSCGETIRITDTGTGHSFTVGEFMYAHNLFNPEQFLVNQTRSSYYTHFRLPVPHLLKPGATLFTEHLNSNDAEQSAFNPEFMIWECVTP